MSNAATPHRWFSGWRTSPPPQAAADPADLGTAFGLDASLSEIPHEPPPSEQRLRRMGWVAWLGARRKPTA